MRRLFHSFVLSSALCLASSASAADPAFVGKYLSTPEDTAAIHKVILDFQTGIKTKNLLLLSTLMVSSDVLFSSPSPPEHIKEAHAKFDVNYTGLAAGGFASFSGMILREKGTIEERFYNIRVTQDDNTAVVMFDFDFLRNGKISNHGLETWQMMKDKDSKWKIASVFWSSKGPLK